ncbi:hypothetical protein ACT17_14595 [Mycolicibacterium conceptionense]|uniref:Uncharacterized protein n=1 Tax=Mycolicibacterium conceptionense TaxID=451644 RepID=A0A0J8WWY1_9MYCO|nr:hypothetical protein [Mycolicibacterium conceptionense]KMV17524.1 hypothetical protein ACT17_14595 [Mycolicibacterium conceptionense]
MSHYTVGERRYVRFDDEWSEPQDYTLDAEEGNPRWFTAVYAGEKTDRKGRTEGWWDVEGVPRWQYATDELVIGDPAGAELWPPVPATHDRTATRP